MRYRKRSKSSNQPVAEIFMILGPPWLEACNNACWKYLSLEARLTYLQLECALNQPLIFSMKGIWEDQVRLIQVD